jgi:hypothetical protein
VCSIICVIAVSSEGSVTPFLLSASNAGGLVLAYKYIGEFWADKAKVPFNQTYNDGIRASQQMHQVLGWLIISWTVAATIYLYRAMAY